MSTKESVHRNIFTVTTIKFALLLFNILVRVKFTMLITFTKM